MKILFLTIGDERAASSRTRVFQYLPHLTGKEIGYRVLSCGSTMQSIKVRIQLLLFCRFYDVIFIQKVLLPIFYQKIIKLLNNNIVFDFDDAIYTHDAVSSARDKEIINKVYRPRLESILQISKLAIIENDETASFARNYSRHILQITGPIDTARYAPVKRSIQNDVVTLGWIGSHSTTPYVKMILSQLEKIVAKYPHVEVVLIGAGTLSDDIPIKIVEWSLSTEIAELRKFDIGIMPLSDDEWTKGKGGYKLLQYMAMGIPCVASPVGVNRTLITEGENGFFASTEEDWISKLSKLIEDHILRERMGAKGRALVENEYSFIHYTPVLIQALEKVAASK